MYNYEMVIMKTCRSPFGIQTCIPFVYKIVLERERDRQRQTDRQTERHRETDD